MKQTIRLVLGLLALVLLTSCGQDPRKEAEADRIRMEASSQAKTDDLNRAHAEELHDINMRELYARQERIEASQESRIAAVNALWNSVKVSGSIAVFILLLAVSISVSRVSYGIASAAVESARINANLITLDRVTRQYPLIRHVHGSRYALHNPNTGSVIMLDENRPEHKQLISTMGVTQLAGVIGQEARQSSDPGAMAMMSPPVINGE